jgi:serine/threonine-protein kinase RsbW
VTVSESVPGKATDTKSPEEHHPDDIELRLAAKLEHLPIIRAVAANLAIRADFDLDSIADLKLAVDEACSTLITRAVPGALLSCVFAVAPNEIRFAGTVAATGERPSQDSFGWRVLTTLTTHAAAWMDRNSAAPVLHIELAKRKIASG